MVYRVLKKKTFPSGIFDKVEHYVNLLKLVKSNSTYIYLCSHVSKILPKKLYKWDKNFT